MQYHHRFAFIVGCSIVLSGASALADDDAQVAKLDSYDTPEEAPSPDAVEPAEDRTRVRAGFNFGGGGAVSQYGAGPLFMAQGRVGAQFTHHWGLYWQAHHVWGSQGTNEDGGGIVASFGNAVLASLTLADHFEIALGPSLGMVYTASCSDDPDENVTALEVGPIDCGFTWTPRFAAHNRLGVHVGGFDEDGVHRSGFSIGVDTHAVFADGPPMVFITGGIGADWY